MSDAEAFGVGAADLAIGAAGADVAGADAGAAAGAILAAGAAAGVLAGAAAAAGVEAGAAAAASASFLLLRRDFFVEVVSAAGAVDAAAGVAAAASASFLLFLFDLVVVVVSVWVVVVSSVVAAFFFFFANAGVAAKVSARLSMVVQRKNLVLNSFILIPRILDAVSRKLPQAERGGQSNSVTRRARAGAYKQIGLECL